MRCTMPAFLAGAMLLGTLAHAQTAVITGTLLDSRGKPVAGYPVVLENQASIAQGYSGNVGYTSDTGQFAITVDQLGRYTAEVPNAPAAATEFTAPPEMADKDWKTWLPLGKGDQAPLPAMDIGTIRLPPN